MAPTMTKKCFDCDKKVKCLIGCYVNDITNILRETQPALFLVCGKFEEGLVKGDYNLNVWRDKVFGENKLMEYDDFVYNCLCAILDLRYSQLVSKSSIQIIMDRLNGKLFTETKCSQYSEITRNKIKKDKNALTLLKNTARCDCG